MDDHAVALAEPDDPRARPRHPPRDLVSEDTRPLEQALLDLLDVREADPTGLDLHQQLARPDLGHRDLLDPQTAGHSVDGGLHPPSRLRSTKKMFSLRSRSRR